MKRNSKYKYYFLCNASYFSILFSETYSKTDLFAELNLYSKLTYVRNKP